LVNVFKSNVVYSFKSGVVLDSTVGSDVLHAVAMTFREVCDATVAGHNKFLADMCGFYKEVRKHMPYHLDPDRDMLHILYSKRYDEASVFVEFIHFEHAQAESLAKLLLMLGKLARNMKAHAYLRYFNDYDEHAILTLLVYRAENPESPLWSLIDEMVKVAGL